MASRTVKFDFYKMSSFDGRFDSQAFSSQLAERLPTFTDPIPYGDRYIRAERYHFTGSLHYGIVSRITMDDLPYKADVTRPGLQSLGLGYNQGIAALTAFLFDPSLSLVVLQRGPVPRNAFPTLFETVTDMRRLRLVYLLENDALHRLERMELIRSCEVYIANPLQPEYYEDYSAKAVAELAAHHEARMVKLVLGMWHYRGSLNVNKAKQTLLGWFRRASTDQGDVIRGLKVKGKAYDDEEYDELDLLDCRIVECVDVTLKGRELDPNALERAVRHAYERRKDEIATLYPPLQDWG